MRRISCVALLCTLFFPSGAGAAWSVKTLIGNGNPGFAGDFGKAEGVLLDNPFGVTRGPDGSFWIAEYGGHRVRRIRPDGMVLTGVGIGKRGFDGDGGPAPKAVLNMPQEVRFDSAGDMFVADMGNHIVRKIDMKTGIIKTVVGTGLGNYAGDGGPANLAYLRQPNSIQFNSSGDMFVSDIGNNVIRKVDAKTGTISTFAGTGKPGPTPDGALIKGTPLDGPRSIDFDKDGNLWVLCTRSNQVFKLDLEAGRIHLMAGTGEKGFTGNGGPARLATFNGPKGLALDSDGNVWIADTENHAIRRIDAKTQTVELVLGSGVRGDGPDGDPVQCRISRPHGLFVDKDGAVYISDSETHRIRVLKKQ